MDASSSCSPEGTPDRARRRRILVTGASTGIGRAIAERFAQGGWTVLGTSRDPDRLRPDQRVPGVTYLKLDQADPDSIRSCAASAGRLDLLVNNAGRFLRRPLLETTDDDFDALFAVNVRPAFRFSRAALPHLIDTRGCIVNTASISGLVGIGNQSAYAMTKGAIVQLTRQLAVECAPHGVRVNAVAPGAVDTDFMAEARAADPDPDASLAATLSNHPIGRMSTSDEVARAIVFLAAPESGGITGTILSVDGGYVAR
jgi:NAD(P)-dependent dehydrogenase (short-subunit alcohol dehydrogenase family)